MNKIIPKSRNKRIGLMLYNIRNIIPITSLISFEYDIKNNRFYIEFQHPSDEHEELINKIKTYLRAGKVAELNCLISGNRYVQSNIVKCNNEECSANNIVVHMKDITDYCMLCGAKMITNSTEYVYTKIVINNLLTDKLIENIKNFNVLFDSVLLDKFTYLYRDDNTFNTFNAHVRTEVKNVTSFEDTDIYKKIKQYALDNSVKIKLGENEIITKIKLKCPGCKKPINNIPQYANYESVNNCAHCGHKLNKQEKNYGHAVIELKF